MKRLPETYLERGAFNSYLANIGVDVLFIVTSRVFDKLLKNRVDKSNVLIIKSGEPKAADILLYHEEILKRYNHSCFVAVGGGSTIDVAKLLTLECSAKADLTALMERSSEPKKKGVKLLVFPTTCGTGSEVTSISIIEDFNGTLKAGIVSDLIIPDCVYLDSELLSDIPSNVFISATFDAVTHSIESYLSPKSSSISREISLAAMKMILSSLDDALNESEDAIEKILYGSYLAGYAFNTAGVGLVHAMAYPLGAKCHIPHGLVNASLLVFVLTFYKKSNSTLFKKLETELVSSLGNDYLGKIYSRLKKLNVFEDVKKYLGTSSDIEEWTEQAFSIKRLVLNSMCTIFEKDIKDIYEQFISAISKND